MDKPTCRLCGAKHYLREPHDLGKGVLVHVKTKGNNVTPVTKRGRPRIHLTNAERQKAYRGRKTQ